MSDKSTKDWDTKKLGENVFHINDEGVYIKAHVTENGKIDFDFYSDSPDNLHSAVHTSFKETEDGYRLRSGSHNEDRSEKEDTTTDLKCFLTTACMRYMEKNFRDDCYELEALRWFRDYYVLEEDKKQYYEIAPLIVEAINNEKYGSLVYEYIYENLIEKCLFYINNGQFEKSYCLYKKFVMHLNEAFVEKKKMIKKI